MPDFSTILPIILFAIARGIFQTLLLWIYRGGSKELNPKSSSPCKEIELRNLKPANTNRTSIWRSETRLGHSFEGCGDKRD
jgi:hypothetical protein